MKFYQILFLAFIILSSSCVKNKKGIPDANQTTTAEKVFEVKEIIQTSKYTYMKVNENSAERWVAVTKMDAKNGDKYYYDTALPMNNFHSKELNRDFETIYFINKVSSIPLSVHEKMNAMSAKQSDKVKPAASSDVRLEKAPGELTIAKIFENKEQYAEKEIEIRGLVVKINKQIMGKNWIHIQDGTNYDGSFDLTVTTQDLPDKNDEVTFKGTLVLDKDFGAGYFYKVIMENATLLKTQKPAAKM